MNSYNYIVDPDTSKFVNIHSEKGINIIENYSNVNGRTRHNLKHFFQFREDEYNVLTNKVRPFLAKILRKTDIDRYINIHLNYDSDTELIETQIENYIQTWNNFMENMSRLFSDYNTIKTSKNNIVLDIETNTLKVKKT